MKRMVVVTNKNHRVVSLSETDPENEEYYSSDFNIYTLSGRELFRVSSIHLGEIYNPGNKPYLIKSKYLRDLHIESLENWDGESVLMLFKDSVGTQSFKNYSEDKYKAEEYDCAMQFLSDDGIPTEGGMPLGKEKSTYSLVGRINWSSRPDRFLDLVEGSTSSDIEELDEKIDESNECVFDFLPSEIMKALDPDKYVESLKRHIQIKKTEIGNR